MLSVVCVFVEGHTHDFGGVAFETRLPRSSLEPNQVFIVPGGNWCV